MKEKTLPNIQLKRFDIESLHENVLDLARYADHGRTWLKRDGRIEYVIMTEECFDQIWPDPRRSWAASETPLRQVQELDIAMASSEGPPDEDE